MFQDKKEKSAVLTYFHGRGRGEQARWMLASTGVEFKNRCLDTNKEFTDLKGSLLFGQLPLLEIDGQNLVQSQAINRYLAKRAGIAGKGLGDQALCDMICESVNDAQRGVIGYPFAPKSDLAMQTVISIVDKYFPKFEAILQANKQCDGKFLVANSLTYADILVGQLAHVNKEILPTCLDKYPKLKALHEMIIALPGVKAYLASDKYFSFPKGKVGEDYVKNVRTVLVRPLRST